MLKMEQGKVCGSRRFAVMAVGARRVPDTALTEAKQRFSGGTMDSRARMLLAAVALSGLAVAGPQAALAKDRTTNGCILDRNATADVLLVKAGDGSILEANAPRASLSGRDRDKSLAPGQCWEFDLDLSGQPVKVFVGQATYAGDVTDIGDYKNQEPGKEAKKDKDEDK